MNHDLTQGSVTKTLLRFAIPFLAASTLQFMYAIVDMIVVGQFSDPAAISAVNTSSQVMQLCTSLISGIATGGTVLIGQYVGAKREKEVTSSIGTLFSLYLMMAAILTAFLLICNHLLISLMQVPEEAVVPARQYLLICGIGTVFITGYNGIAGILRGLGDSKRPAYFIACSCILNILGDLLLVGGFHLGAAGAAIATVAAQAVSFLLSLFVLSRGNFPFRFGKDPLRLDPDCAKKVLSLGVPISAQDVLVTFSFVLITAIVNRMGVNASAAVGIVERIISFCMLVPIAFMSALSAFTAQNVGAEQKERAGKGLKVSLLICLGGCLVFFAIVQLVPQWVAGLFTPDKQVIENCALYLRTYGFDIIMVSFVFCFNGFFSGYGRTQFTMANCLLSTFLVRVPVVYFMSRVAGASLLLIGIAAPLASLFQILIQLGYYRWGKWRDYRAI